MRKHLIILVMTMAWLLALGVPASLALPNLVTNGGFENGSFAGWTHSGNSGATVVESTVLHDGNFAAALGPVGSNGTLSQVLNTIVGDTYQISFWFLEPKSDKFNPFHRSAPAANLFTASFEGEHLLTRRNTRNTSPAWIEYVYEITATSTTSLLEFSFRDDPGYEYLDEVSVCDLTPPPPPAPAPVPEPGSMLLLGSGVLALAVYTKRRRER
ncbi:hypothetical protein GMLC_28160 [Geomonas limicola]|uniref:PEP-CTERM protein-sorting domain-containing protein n=1 Tax=Geomonas limicola TaxID=2740186 RepID=A0A6V8NBR8_9BACT|nr:carbohydrate binding domain-containing protein [Geomonas limicola]GFO69237.1 hypothetical protein GMLC_28160 [Geomonas limicola]